MRFLFGLGLIMACLSGAAGCSHVSPTPSFYLLDTPCTKCPVPVNVEDLSVGIGTVTLPGHLDRLEIVTRTDDGTGIRVNEFYRWAAPLNRQIRERLMAQLSFLLDTPRVVMYPWPRASRPKFRVDAAILRFEPADDIAVLSAIWTIRDVDRDAVCLTDKFSAAVPFDSDVKKGDNTLDDTPEVAAYVAAQGRALAAMGQEIALGLVRTALGGCKSPDN